MKTISYYISMVVILAATIFTGCTDDDEKSLSPRAGELSIYEYRKRRYAVIDKR